MLHLHAAKEIPTWISVGRQDHVLAFTRIYLTTFNLKLLNYRTLSATVLPCFDKFKLGTNTIGSLVNGSMA